MAEEGTLICPAGSSDSESGELGDQGDFGLPVVPDFESQKNLVKIAQDPRTNTLLATQGMDGNFDEDPPSNPVVIRSKDCGQTWTQVADLIADGVIESYNTGFGGNLDEMFHIPMVIIPGLNPGEWILMDFIGGYYLSEDDGETWSELKQGGIGFDMSGFFPSYTGVVGISGQFDTRAVPAWHYIEAEQIGYIYIFQPPDAVIETVGVRRSIGPNGEDGWEDSLPPTVEDWEWMGSHPVLHGANGRWIAIVDVSSVKFSPVDGHIRINFDTDLSPDGWSEPFYMIDESYLDDIYQGQASHLSPNLREFGFLQGHPRLKFIPMDGHPVGGRWWFMGVNDCLLYSDDNGVTWSNSLSDHREPEAAMHPILNWRDSHAYTTRASPARVLDIVADPLDDGRLISIGITYDREGITNRLAVYSCSTDGGDTWGDVGQLPLSLSNSENGAEGGRAGGDSPSVARHMFPCFGGR